ncbi:MAG TPA: 5'/3'-nucleotidase SurE [Longimicrobium sp.]|jgi:5'-nucleotidase|uniref:5'/3'-nucleotidase SurE n=1 Tax=Longimicrobium sp. TaxID=2029185 RepID=UPI002ED97963
MFILCTNDDGYLAPGLGVLAEAARTMGSVHVVAPDREQSAQSHALTMHFPLRAREVREGVHHVDGTPTDCVAVAIGALLPKRPDLVLSGVNHGPNMGEDVLYSGTVAAAMEATILGIPSVAVSYAGRDAAHMESYGPLLARLLPQLVDLGRFPPETLLNINLPPIDAGEVKGVEVTRLARRVYLDSLTRAKDPNGREYFWIGGGEVEWSAPEGTDFYAVNRGYVSVTPLHLDLTNHALLQDVAAWKLHL